MTNETEFEALITRLRRAHAWLEKTVTRALQAAGHDNIGQAQAFILYGMGKAERPLKPTEFWKHSVYLQTNYFHNVRKLVRLGYVAEKPYSGDARCVLYCLTKQGHQAYEAIRCTFAKHGDMLAKLGRNGSRPDSRRDNPQAD